MMVVHPAAGYVSREEPRRRTTDEAPLGCATIKRVMSVIGPEGAIRELFRRFADRMCV
jgi:hypothetical protein